MFLRFTKGYVLLIILGSFLINGCQSTQVTRSVPSNLSLDQSKDPIDRMIIYRARVELVVEEPDSTAKQLSKIAKSFGGYLSKGSNRMNEIRVKSDQLEPALDVIAGLGKVKSRNIFSEDVTDTYKDLQIRLDNASQTRNRYLALLEKANEVEEILKIEKELERLSETIDLLKGKINQLEDQESLAAITIEVIPLTKPGIFGYVGVGLYKAVAWLFVRK